MSIDAAELFRLDANPLELIVRVSVVYLGLLFALRLISRREMGAFEAPELLMIILIADGVTHGMTGEYSSITAALIIGATLIGWNYALDWLVFHLPFVERLLRPPALTIVEHGRFRRRNMRKEMITEDEVMSHLRQQGVQDIAQVKLAVMEADGELSVIREDGGESEGRSSRARQRAI